MLHLFICLGVCLFFANAEKPLTARWYMVWPWKRGIKNRGKQNTDMITSCMSSCAEWQDYTPLPFWSWWLPQVPPSAPLSSLSTFTLSRSRPAWIWAVKRSSRRVWLAHFVESLNIQGGPSFEAAPGSPFVSEAALFILTYAKWSLTWGKPQKNTSGTLKFRSPTLQHPLEIRVLMDDHVCVLYNHLVNLFNHRFYDF